MRILLVGEYSNLHNSLQKGLQELNHEVLLISIGDGFKKYKSDILIKTPFKSGFLKKVNSLFVKIFKLDLHSIYTFLIIKKYKDDLKGYDIVQYINESPFLCTPDFEIKIFNFLKKQNKKSFLLSCGTDYTSVKYAYDKRFKYSILTPFFENKISEEQFFPILKYLTPSYKKLHEHLLKNIEGIIASDLDYHLPLLNHPKYLGLIPNPVNISNFEYSPPFIDDKLVIFHGINQHNYFKKGNDLFDQALEIIIKRHPNKISIKTVVSLPYNEYINSFKSAHILLDQVYAYDQGFNALEAMAMGKVVFTGAEKEWLDYYNLKENNVAINASPNVSDIVEKLEWLILNPDKITEISHNARKFIELEHNNLIIAQKYLDKWVIN